MSEKVVVNKDALDKIKTKLKGLKVSVEDKNAKSIIDEILKIFEDEIFNDNFSLEKIIKDKMAETKISNPDQNFKLYMLHRRLTDNKITQEEALRDFKNIIMSD
jgi:hypothetical protein